MSSLQAITALLGAALTASAEVAEAAQEAHASGGAALVSPDFAVTIATWITFGLLVFLISRFGWSPLVKALDAREEAIKDSVRRAETARKEAEELLAGYQRKIDQAKSESDSLIAQARSRGEEVVQRMTAEAKHQSEAITQKAMDSIEAERLRAVTELRGIVADASVMLAGRILKEELSPVRHAKLIDGVVADITGKTARR